ncbi:MAG: hypothetical protein GWN58_21620, partial [Anaerolineae bacterium]|nr:hypothetical protein [Anaerolineae bacterium]
METQRHEELLRHAREYINILLYEGKAAKAAEVFRACYRVDSGFKPADPDRYYSLASVLRQLQAHKEVLGLITDFHRAFPKHPDVPRLYLLAAQVYSEALHRDDQATRILRYLVARYPGHELQPQIQHYL